MMNEVGVRARRVLGLLTAALVVAGAVAGCSTGDDAVVQGNTFQFVSPDGKTVISYPVENRKPLAPFEGPDVATDELVAIADSRFENKVVVINVWGSWCGPCRAEADDLETVYQETKADGVEFLGINLRDDRQSAKDFIVDRQLAFPSIYDFYGATLAALTTPTSVVPTTIVLDRQHRPAAVFLKSVTADELGATVREIAAESPAPSGVSY